MFYNLVHLIQTNPVLSGAVGFSTVGGMFYWLRSAPARLVSAFLWLFTVTMDVSNEDKGHEWLAKWLSTSAYARRCRRLSVATHRDKANTVPAPRHENAPSGPHAFYLFPARGSHFFWHGFRPVFVHRYKEDVKADLDSGAIPERIMLRTLGRSQAPLRKIMEEARQLSTEEQKSVTPIYIADGVYWERLGSQSPRKASSVILRDGVMEGILNDLGAFAKSSETYATRGIPYRRGYLFFGSPGNGKTSAVMVMAAVSRKALHILNLNSVSDDQSLQRLICQSDDAIVLIEDVDVAFAARDKEQRGVTFSGLLNALDGAITPEGQVIVMTTNHPERLDPALIRPGRVDVRVEFLNSDAEMVERMSARFGQPGSPALIGKSMAEVQQALLEIGNDSTVQ